MFALWALWNVACIVFIPRAGTSPVLAKETQVLAEEQEVLLQVVGWGKEIALGPHPQGARGLEEGVTNCSVKVQIADI